MAESKIKAPEISYTNTLKNNVNLASYTSSNRYTAPTDGYVWVRTDGQADIHIANGLGATIRSSNGNDTDGCVYVKKGLTLYVDGIFSYAYFRSFEPA